MGANFVLLLVVIVFVLDVKRNEPKGATAIENQSSIFNNVEVKPLDNVSTADAAVNIARLTGLPESVAVVNKADTVKAELAIAASDNNVAIKPQIVGAGLKSNKDIITYVTVEGDTIPKLADKFGIDADTIRISNDIAGDAISVGKQLLISPVNGIVYKVKSGDTPTSLANKYHAEKSDIIAFNDIEITGNLVVDSLIVIPGGVQPSVPVVATSYRSSLTSGYSSAFSFGTAPIYSANGYDYGWCTWHAANRRKEIGRPIPSNWGNAISWLYNAQAMGFATGGTPAAGAVVYHKNIGGLGHVAFVEKINPDGSILISDMNYPIWGRVTYRTVGPAEFGNYAFIY